MILGLPLYTRVWVNESGRWKSRVLTLKYTDQFISRHKLRPVWNDEEKQYTSSWKEKGTAYKTWLEDAKSLEDKMSLVGKYGLGGTAFWRYGFEAENTFSELLNVKENQEKTVKSILIISPCMTIWRRKTETAENAGTVKNTGQNQPGVFYCVISSNIFKKNVGAPISVQ